MRYTLDDCMHEVTLREFCLSLCYDVMLCVLYVLDTVFGVSVLYVNPIHVNPSRSVAVVAYIDMRSCQP